eukprot:scaffold1203_cov117-Cylindrotheca_fusiformis.AAC.13
MTACVVKHFDDFHEDQFDFHAYCIRKVTLRAYTEVLKFEDSLWAEDYYFRAASGIIKIYLHLYDNPSTTKEAAEPDYSKMNAAERKKAKAVARKKKKQAEKKEAERQKKEGSNTDKGDQNNDVKKSDLDEDPLGEELAKMDPLEEARKYSAVLSKHCKTTLETWALQYDVSVRRKKWLLALQALFKMHSLAPTHAEFFSRLVDFALQFPSSEGQPDAVKLVITQESSNLLNRKSVADYISEAAEQAKSNRRTSLPLRTAIAEAMVKTNPSSVNAASALVVDGGIDGTDVSVESCRKALAVLKGFRSASVEKWQSTVLGRFPRIEEFS